MTTGELDPRKVEEIADKAIGYLSGAGVAALVYLGDRLGLYSALREAGPRRAQSWRRGQAPRAMGSRVAPRASQRGTGALRG